MIRTTRLLLALVLLLPAPARALSLDRITQYKTPNIHWGQLALHPHYRLTEVYDSNIYLVPRDRPGNVIVGGGVRGSWITKNELGLELELPWRRLHNLTAGYAVDFHKYSTDAQANDAINQAAHVDYAYTGAYGLSFRAGDRYLITRDQAFSQLVSRDRRWMNTTYAALDYDKENGNLAGGVDASHTVHKYLGEDMGRLLNRYSQRAGFNLGYKVRPRTKVYASYHRGLTRYTVGRAVGEQDRNSKSHDFALGVEGVVAPKIDGRAEAGVAYREYDEAPLGGVTSVTRNLTVMADLVYRPVERTDVILTLTRALQESISGSNRFYISHSAVLDIKHRLPRKFSVGVNAAYGVDKYPDTQFIGATGARGDRRDDIYQGGAWIEYDIQAWLSTGLSYLHRERNSTFTSQFNYQVHETAWNLALKF